MRLIPPGVLCALLAGGGAAQSEPSPISLADLTQVRAGSVNGGQTVINFPGPDVKLDVLRVEPFGAGFIVNLRFLGFSESCGAGNCDQAAFTLAAQIALPPLSRTLGK